MQTFSPDWLLRVARGKVSGAKIIHKFGATTNALTTWTAVTTSGNYPTPIAPQTLEILSSSADDTAAGIGAQSVEVYGIDNNWDIVKEIVPLNGLTPVVLQNQFYRVWRMHIYHSGTYASLSTASHVGEITLRLAGGGETWATILNDAFPVGASEIGCFTVPRGHTAYILDSRVVLEAGKICDIALFFREGADITAGGTYDSMFTADIVRSVLGLELSRMNVGFSREFKGPCDLGFMAATTDTKAKISVAYDILILDDNIRDNIRI